MHSKNIYYFFFYIKNNLIVALYDSNYEKPPVFRFSCKLKVLLFTHLWNKKFEFERESQMNSACSCIQTTP